MEIRFLSNVNQTFWLRFFYFPAIINVWLHLSVEYCDQLHLYGISQHATKIEMSFVPLSLRVSVAG